MSDLDDLRDASERGIEAAVQMMRDFLADEILHDETNPPFPPENAEWMARFWAKEIVMAFLNEMPGVSDAKKKAEAKRAELERLRIDWYRETEHREGEGEGDEFVEWAERNGFDWGSA